MSWNDPRGYIRCWVGDREEYVHRVVAAQLLGRPLRKTETVHHRNGVKDDNRPANLEVIDAAEHVRIHWREGKYRRRVASQQVPESDCVRCQKWGKPHARKMCKRCYHRDYYERNLEKWARG